MKDYAKRKLHEKCRNSCQYIVNGTKAATKMFAPQNDHRISMKFYVKCS